MVRVSKKLLFIVLLGVGSIASAADLSSLFRQPTAKQQIEAVAQLQQSMTTAGKSFIKGAVTGFNEAMQEPEFAQAFQKGAAAAATGITKGSFEAADAFAQAVRDPKFSENLNNGMGNLSKALTDGFGTGTKEFSEGFATKIAPNARKIVSDAISIIYNKNNFLKITGFTVAATSAYYVTPLIWEAVKVKLYAYLYNPTVLLPNAKTGYWDRMKRYMSGYKTPDMIFPQEVKDRLTEIVEKTKNILHHRSKGKQVTFDNLILHGDPGTGKTLFATVLADETGMDFAPTTAGALLQPGAGVKYLNELVTMAQSSSRGVIIFIDEADAFFVDRSKLNIDSDHYKVLNHLLALTGTGSDKFMLIAATNRMYVMDEAMGRRFQDSVYLPLPDETTRKDVVELYVKNILLNEKETSRDFVASAQQVLTENQKAAIAGNTEGLSCAEIKDIMHAMYKKALATKECLLTENIVKRAISEGVEKRKINDANKRRRDSENTQLATA